MLWVIPGQAVLLIALLNWCDSFPFWLNRIFVVSVILLPVLAYLIVLSHPSILQAWHDLLLDCWQQTLSASRAFSQLLHPATIIKLMRLVGSIRLMPATIDEWITFCVLPFKTCIVAAFPIFWLLEKTTSPAVNSRPYGRALGLSYELLLECYLISLLALLSGALIQAICCRAGRATTTLRFFLLGLILLFLTGMGLLVP